MTPGSKRLIGIALLATSVVLSAAGQLGMKAGMQALKHLPDGSGESLQTALAAAQSPAAWTIAGLTAYAVSMLAWLAALVRYPLSYAYPFLSLSYVLVYVGATHWERLAESATATRTAGTVLILVGVGLASLVLERPGTGRTSTPNGGRV